MIILENARKDYQGFSLDCTMKLERGRVTGLVGANGSGKSTTYKLILGLIHPDGGTIRVLGKDVSELTADDRQKIGVVLSESGFSGYLCPKDILKIMKSFYPAFNEEFFSDKCIASGIVMDKKIRNFSTGMKEKLRVIAAVSQCPELLVLDEPTAGLDVIAREETLNILREYMSENANRSILISSHICADLESICDDIYMIDGGKIIFHDDTDRILSDYAILKLTEEEYGALDRQYLLRVKSEPWGISALTDQKQFYFENYPGVVTEKCSPDSLLLMMKKGEKI